MKKIIYILTLVFVTASIACYDKDDLTALTEQEMPEVEAIELSDTVLSNAVTFEEARKDLEIFLKDFPTLTKKGGISTRTISGGFTLESEKKSLKKSTGDTSTAKIHVFNFEDDGGFAIMSATRDLPALLAITDGGNIDTNETIDNPGLIMFLTNLEAKMLNGGVERQIDTISLDGNIQSEKNSLSKLYYTYYKNKIYKPQNECPNWHQESPYNEYCKTDSGETAVVGCVAVACAQLMAIYHYPQKYQTKVFNWDKMVDNKNKDKNDVAWLLQQLGDKFNLDMTYGKTGSSAYPDNIPRTLKNFGYSNGGKLENYVTYKICNELIGNHPVLIGGCSHKIVSNVFGTNCSSVSYEGSHRWIGYGLLVRTKEECHI